MATLNEVKAAVKTGRDALADGILHAHAWGPPAREERLRNFLAYYDLKADRIDQNAPLESYHAESDALMREALDAVAIPN